ncbi:MAG: hypothetical protein EOP63_00630 [Sphingomonadales bacterium]|nr:MAG: hypothetical protein EOP63_00630 [Sphingomonadales bacterium]
MSLEEQLFEIERGFWSQGADYFAAHLDERCLLAFPQSGEMHGLFSRDEVAATATSANRWRDLEMSDRQLLKLSNDVAMISYKADVTRADGVAYSALIASAYVRRSDAWLLASHQHSPLTAD